MAEQAPRKTPMGGPQFRKALIANTVWVNLSGLPRYFLVVAPMLETAFPDDPDVAPITLPIFALWGLWTVVFMLATTGFFWMYFDREGISSRTIASSAVWVTMATIALTWFGIANMGLAPYKLLYVATAWALVEQIVSAKIVSKLMAT